MFNQIVDDFTDAEALLSNYNGDPRVPSKQAAQALLARTYLVWGDNPLSYDQVNDLVGKQQDPAFTTTPSGWRKPLNMPTR